MKTYKYTRSLFRSQAFPCAITLSLLAAGSASAVDGTWTGGSVATWATATNWSGSIVPGGTAANSDKATFNSGTYAFAPTAANSYFIGGLIFGSSSGAITITTGTADNRLNVGSDGILVDASLGAVSIGASAAASQGASIVASQNWTNNSSSLLTVNRVSVDNLSLAGTYTLTINGSGSGGVNFLNTIGDVNNASNASNLFALQINSTGGNTTISSGNTFTGGTTLTQGNLLLGNNAALGTGSLALNGGKISSNATSGQAPANNATIGGNVTLGDAVNTGKLTFSGTMSLGGFTRTLTTDSSVEFSGVVSNGGITKQGASTLTFLGASANTYTDLTTVSAGSLTLGKTSVNAIAGNVLVNGTGTLTLSAADQIINTSNVEVAAGTLVLATFNETVNGVKLTGGTITGTTGVLTSGTAYDFQSSTNVTGSLAGTAGANKTTAGTVTFTGGNANTYTGLTTVSAGILVLGRTTGVVALAGNAFVNGGTLQITNPNQITDSANLEVATNGTFAMGSNSDTVNNLKLTGGTITGSGTLTSTTAFDFQSSVSIAAVLAGTAGANKTTVGTVTFSGANANTYTGLTTVSAGSLVLSKTASAAALAGDALVNGGTLKITAADQIINSANLEVATGGIFVMGTNSDTVNNLKLTGGEITGSGTLTSATAFDFQSSGNIGAVLAGTAGANKTTVGTVTFSGDNANTYTGLTTVSAGSLVLSKTPGVVALAGDALVNGGTLRIAGVDQIVDTANLEVVTGGTFALGGNTDTVNGVKLTGGTITGTGINGILTSITAYDLQSGSSTAVLAGTAGATKTTAGTVTLTKANTYTGATTVSDGTLAVTGSLGATAVSVNAGTLAGNGNIGGNVTIASGAHHALAVAATADTQATRAITGTLALTAGNVLDLTAAATPASGVYVLATATTAITGSPTTINYNGITGGTISVDTASSPNRLLLTIAGSPYDTWAAGFLPEDVSNPAGNNDGDGLTNLQEFAFGTQPTGSTGEIVYSGGTLTTPGAPKLVAASGTYSMVFGRRADYVAAGLTYTVQFSADLVTWVDNDDVANVPAQVATDNTINVMSVTYPATIVTQSGTPNPKFSRVKVVLAP